MLSKEAEDTYLHISICSFDYRFISCFEYASRLCYLSSIITNEKLKKWLRKESFLYDKDTENDSDDNEELSGYKNFDGNFLVCDTDSSNDTLAFLTSDKGILKEKWRFNQYDRDYYPSIPHGHLDTKHHIKLDCYRGYTFNTSAKNKPLQREKKNFIVSLWNDDKFREFSLKQILFYINEYPAYKWRVRNPLCIPRKRL